MELTDITHVAASRADDLREMGLGSVNKVANADPDDLQELSRVGENKAIEMVVSAENLVEEAREESDEADEELVEDGESITFDEGDAESLEDGSESDESESEGNTSDETKPDSEATEDDSTERGIDEAYVLSLDLEPIQREILISALLDQYTSLKRRNRSRSQACFRVLEKSRDGDTLSLTEEELNALHAALRQQRTTYQGENHVDLMNYTQQIERDVTALREEELF